MTCYTLPEPVYFLFAEGVPALLYYSHIPTALVALLIGLFVFRNNPRALLNRLLLGITVVFALWCFFDLILWTNIDSDTVIFTWSLLGIVSSLISLLSIYFISVFLYKKDMGFVKKLILFLLLLPVLLLTPTAHNLSGFNLELCGSSGFEGIAFLNYYTALGLVAMFWILVMLVHRYRTCDKLFRKQIVLMGIGIELFLFSFFIAGYLASYLNDAGLAGDYSLEQYGLFGMTVFVALISFMIVRFRTFNVGMLAAQALVVALVILIGSQFTFIKSTTNLVLTSITLVLTGIIGLVLIRSVKREIEQRQHIEKLALELEKANKQQIILIHFITHQIKGFLTKSRNIFAMALEGDLGPVPETMKPMIEEGFKSDTKGVNTIQEILNAANIKSGKVTYSMSDIDLKALIEEVAGDLRPNAESKGLELTIACGTEPIAIKGDRVQLVNAFKNLIDNSIKYTPSGSVNVSLTKEGSTVRFMVEDTGVGITKEDMAKLFTEGGHGTNSTKVNVESTGFGLYIVKNIIEAHHGKVWAESEGEGKGSRFIAELPA